MKKLSEILEKSKKKFDPSMRGTPEFENQIKEWTKHMYRDKQGNYITIEELELLFRDPDYKFVKHEFVEEFFISTVWLGVKHFNDAFFETMIFTGVPLNWETDPDGVSWKSHACFRYETIEQATNGHKRIIELMRQACAKYAGDVQKIIEEIEISDG